MMITCKEDLNGTWVKGTPELVMLYKTACDRFCVDYKINDFNHVSDSFGIVRGIDNGVWHNLSDASKIRSKELTLKDFESLHQQEVFTFEEKVYKSLTELISDIEKYPNSIYYAAAMQNNELVDEYIVDDECLPTLRDYVEDRSKLYRKVIKVIDWKKDVKAFLKEKVSDLEIDNAKVKDFNNDYLVDCYPEKFLEMCRVALRATGELK